MMERLHAWYASLVEQPLREALDAWGGRLLVAALILLVGWWLAKRLSRGAQRVLERSGADPLLGGFVRNLVFVLLIAIFAVGALDRAGVPTASLLAALGATGLAIGLALQGSLSNLAAGMLLAVFRPFRVGQYVEANGIGGTVQDVTLMHTHLLTPDNRLVILPNATVAGNTVVNFSARATRRIDLVVGIAHEADIASAIAATREVLAAEPRVLADPAAEVAVADLGGSGVNLAIGAWVATPQYAAVRSALLQAIKERFDAEGIRLPPAPRDVVLLREATPPAQATRG